MKIAVVASTFNREIVDQMVAAAGRGFEESGIKDTDVKVVWVHGAFEIPAIIQQISTTKKFDGAIGIGCVVKGETDHYDYVCQGVAYGMQKVAIESELPIMSSILTVQTGDQARARVERSYDHSKELVMLINLYNQISLQ